MRLLEINDATLNARAPKSVAPAAVRVALSPVLANVVLEFCVEFDVSAEDAAALLLFVA